MLLELLTNLDQNLIWIVQNYGFLIYPFLFLIIFIETGLVIIPFLPGDSLLFTSGVLASQGLVNVLTIFLITALAAILGDTVNYWIGNFVGKKISNGKLVRKEHLIKTQKFYEKYGGKTIIIARFIPIIRTFAPFVAGIGKMKYSKFLLFNIIGGILWTSVMVFSGFFFGNIPIVKDNLSVCIILIVIISFIPAIVELIKGRRKV
ncbi:MAG: VTT domain-containing protein [Nanoarchaeota archaeon]